MAVYISVVSHNHSEIIEQLNCLPHLSEEFNVIVKLNRKEEKSYYNRYTQLHILDEQYDIGFGHNNNLVYSYCKKHLGMQPSDYFIVLNPDVFITVTMITNLVSLMTKNNVKIGAINLYKDMNYSIYDESVRDFPILLDFVMSFLGYGNKTVVNKSEIKKPTIVDWAAGSFLVFQSSHYSKLGGFDECYFMYCEDIDICYRSSMINESVVYFPNIKAVHLAKHSNRKLISKHFYWHVKSIVRYLLSKKKLTSKKSLLECDGF
ncbi:glycosyltransferase family 2 protein [Vibrio hangzhouensis]|uniref:Glycosyltransferase 2-like domain-containing protein n=1 Tax=Vibrio hangzhouensis TaxID=462991 RepID=A0A1H6BZR5_9VIBR|nr:glycosyltransferase family 2 protein [Vibrio hangzhouensis]SEG65925.1 hypothetical protein SAMN04488244_1283 [Vibrio hangzhouensis]